MADAAVAVGPLAAGSDRSYRAEAQSTETLEPVMSTKPLEQAIASTRAVLAGVASEQMTADKPCAAWKVSDLINHVVGAQHFFTAGVTGASPAGSDTDFSAGDYMAAFDDASGSCIDAFRADGIMDKMVAMPFGEMPGSAVMGLAMTDTFTHGWDLAKATGQDTNLAPELAAGLLEQARMSIQPAFRSPEGSVFGPEKEAPAGASNADQLAAFLGRTV